MTALYTVAVLLLLGLFAFCSADKGRCKEKWTLVYSHDAGGNRLDGDKGELIQAALGGAPVRICRGGMYCSSLQYLQVKQKHLCGQAIFHISKASYNTFQNNAYWWFSLVCTTGDYYMARYNVGEHVSRSDNAANYSIDWFVRFTGCHGDAAFSTTTDGTVVRGSVSILIDAVDQAADIRVVNRDTGSVCPLENVGYDPARSTVKGQAIWEVSQEMSGDHFIYQSNAYWVSKSYSSAATISRYRWSVGDHVNRGSDVHEDPLDWYLDDCWNLAYSHQGNGTQVQGSLTSLISAINKGHRVKLVFPGFSVEPSTVHIKDNKVYAQVINKLGHVTNQPGSIDPVTHWDWKMVNTDGTVETMKLRIGDTQEHTARSSSTESIKWFVDNRKWRNVLETSNSGAVTSGSKDVLQHVLLSGAEVRLQVKSNSASSKTFTADNLAISGDNIGAMNVREVSLTNEMSFQANPYWFFTITDSNGLMDIVRWTVGQHVDRSRSNVQTFGVVWFAEI